MKNNTNKEMKPIVFCNIGWSEFYLGEENGPLIGGGAYVKETGSGNEHLNYYPIIVKEEDADEERTMLLGSFETKHNRGNPNQFRIERIHGCSSLRREDFADDVIVVWCATHPEQGHSCVVGWYNHATVCRFYETMPIDSEDGTEWERWYNVMCRFEDAILLPAEVRSEAQWAIPRHSRKKPVPYGFGRANVWYATEPDAGEFVKRMIRQIENYAGEDAKCEIL